MEVREKRVTFASGTNFGGSPHIFPRKKKNARTNVGYTVPSAVTGAVIGGAFGVFVAVTSATGLPAFDGIVGGAIGGTVGGIAGGIIGCVSGAILGCVDRIAVRRVVIGACSAAGIGVGASLGMLLVIPPVVTMVVKALNARIAKRFNFKKDSLSGELASVNSGAGE